MYSNRILTEAEANNAILFSNSVPAKEYPTTFDRIKITPEIEAILEEQDKKTIKSILERICRLPISLKDFSKIENELKGLSK